MRVTRLLMVALTLAAVATTLVSAQPGVVGSDGGPNDVERESRVQKTRVLAKIASGILGTQGLAGLRNMIYQEKSRGWAGVLSMARGLWADFFRFVCVVV